MIAEMGKSPVTMLRLQPAQGKMLRISWALRSLERGRLAGVLVVYDRDGSQHDTAVKKLEKTEDADVWPLLERGGWIDGMSREQTLLISVQRAGTQEYSVLAATFQAPCRIELWPVSEENGRLHFWCGSVEETAVLTCKMKLRWKVQTREFVPAQYGGLFGRKLIAPAVTGVELVLSTDGESGGYQSGAALYQLKREPELDYPIPAEALNQPLRFISNRQFSYQTSDFDVVINPQFREFYEI